MAIAPKTIHLFFVLVLFASCGSHTGAPDMAWLIRQVDSTENVFMLMTAKDGVQAAFTTFADDSAVIKRGNDSLIFGKQAIANYYSNPVFLSASVSWKPDFIDVSDDGTMAWTYGRYEWKLQDPTAGPQSFRGVFHTVWKRQANGSWKYVWD